MLFGGRLADTFVFDASHAGRDRVADLEPWDRIALTGFGYETPQDALDHLARVGDTTVFSDQGVTIVFEHVVPAEFTPDMILLSL